MKSLRIPHQIVGALLLAAALVTSLGCLAPYDVAGGVSVSIGPPPVRYDERSVRPGPDYLWVSGYWDWGGGDWLWVPGTWTRSPHSHAHWVGPRYHQRHGHWYYTRGHWN